VPDDVFKLLAKICRKIYTLEELSNDIFIHNIHTQPDVLSQDLPDILWISALNSTATCISLWN
jgi:hypothetical protein